MDIFVGSLPFKLNEPELRKMFEKYGEVSSVKIIINKATHMKKGFAFVVMQDDSHALEAIAALNGMEVMGRKIEVTKSEAKKEAPGHSPRKKETPENQGDDKPFHVWPRKLFPKKKKEKVVDYPEIEQKKAKKTKGGGIKSARNFKVGGRKKR